MLKLEQISKAYALRGKVLDELDLNINKGDSVAITGPSGSGKTTLMNIIGTLARPDSGRVLFEGRSLTNLDPDALSDYRNRNIGFVFQDHLLLNHLTVKENILLPLFAEKTTGDLLAEGERFCDSLMQKVGIRGLEDKYPFQISGGEAQRTTLVRALIRKPSLLLADEPTGSLDAKNAEALGRLLTYLNTDTGITIIVATHSSDLASRMAFHMRLEEGKLII